jgi:hypothetical protein
MTAREIIDQIKTLPSAERAQVLAFLNEMRRQQESTVRIASEQTFAEAAEWTFARHAELLRKLSD